MAKPNPLDFFDEIENLEAIKLPTGGGVFQPRGFIAPWVAAIMFSTMSQNGPEALEGVAVAKHTSMGESGWHRYYFANSDDAKEGVEKLGGKFAAQETWVWETETACIVNASDPAKVATGFGPVVSYECQINSLTSNKSRHILHMITLPSVVHATAKLYGYDVPDLDFSDLTVREDDFPATEENMFRLIGNPKAKPDDVDYWKKSVLWQQRAALWAALDEPNAEAFEVVGTKDYRGQKSKFATTSTKMQNCLKLLAYPWVDGKGKPRVQWARVAAVLDPRVEAVTKSGKRITLPFVVDIFGSEEEARAIAEAELSGNEKSTEESPTGSSATGTRPAYPKGWEELQDEWEGGLRTAVAEKKANKDVVSEFDVTMKDVVAWKKFLGI